MAIWLLSLLFESPLIQLLETERTDEVLRVKLFSHGSDASARDGLLTAGA